MTATVLVCGKVFDGVQEGLTGPAEILIMGNRIAGVPRSVDRRTSGPRN
jgi:hypothetical protein